MQTSVLLALILSLAGEAVAVAAAAGRCTNLQLSGGGTWVDKPYGTGCDWYGAEAQRCGWYGSRYRNEHVANEACCVCGGGKTSNETDVPATPSPPTDAPATPSPPTGCGPRVRKGWSMLSCTEREHFIEAVRTLHSENTTDYHDLSQLHRNNGRYAHGTSAFLPWHRWFLVGYENALRSLPGFECMTVPYWDWERDDAEERFSTTFRAKTFGTRSGVGGWPDNCVTEGVAAGWTASDGDCLSRNWGGAGFTGAMEISAIITSNAAFRNFRPALEGNPHAAPHIYVSGHMGSYLSPDDPLFFVHHANVDRIWALWQDYHGYDKVPKAAINDTVYAPASSAEDMSLEGTLPFSVDGRRIPSYFSDPVTIRDMHLITDLPQGASYTYHTDNLADLIGNPKMGNWDLVLPGAAPKLTCCGDGTVDTAEMGGAEECDDGNTVDGDGCSSTCANERGASREGATLNKKHSNNKEEEKKKDHAAYKEHYLSDKKIELMFDEADEARERDGESKTHMFIKLAKEECSRHSTAQNQIPDSFITMMKAPTSVRSLYKPCGSLE
eukprot:TRINITY_DN32_c0_g1_i15.p1 TRINITY_DN32_c0_g1~~TRINITY_DN32_c0_g1_i15.p1  ORF type:complete len:554 (+),score=170.35 TRINITY_DN32_c0_g1_i15:134-1795(+)